MPSMTDFDPANLPWDHEPTYEGEPETWQHAYEEVLAAAMVEHISHRQAKHYLTWLVEMFHTPALRTPHAVLAARMCFIYTEPGEV